ncbi:MAG: flagellar biosynthesis protein FlhB [Desulfobacterales bacterium]|nr:MAG: flagellar biosynthesis protein FlhB [Desulfobacterales bacterium]
MPEGAGQERTERATSKRRAEARRKGQVAQSKEIPSVLVLMAALGYFYFAGAWMFGNLTAFVGSVYQNIATIRLNSVSDASSLSLEIFKHLLTTLAPFLLLILIAGLAGNLFQIGFEIYWELLQPKLSKLNPLAGIKRFLSLRSLVELAKSLAKLLFVGGIAYLLIRSETPAFPPLIHQEVGDIFAFIGWAALRIGFFVCLALLFLAFIDYVYQRWQYEEDLKMTKQEVKDERKQTEGDPKIKSRIRSLQLEMAKRRMMEAVPEADVVITNPTHLAIALQFDAHKMIAPCVLAKGAGHVADRIKAIARENRIPIVEDKPLAQALFQMVEIGDFIPVDLYRAVAEVLAYVYRLKGMHGMA